MTLAVFANEDVGWRLIVEGSFEHHELVALRGLIRKDDVCVDVGANIGLYTVFFAQCAPSGHVHAFEPVHVNRLMLELNCALNDVENVTFHETVLAEELGAVSFCVSDDSAYSSMKDTGRKPAARNIEVTAGTLDHIFFERERPISVLKVDVEGAELLVLKGGRRLLSDPRLSPRVILIELNAQNQAAYNTAPDAVLELLCGFGYEPYSITPRGVVRGWPPPSGTPAAEDVLFLRAT